MKKILLFFVLFTISFTHEVAAQWFQIDSLKIVPTQPVRNDDVTMYLYTRTYGKGIKIYFTHNVNGNNINIQGCYTISGVQTSTYHQDTIHLGKLNDGIYHINITSYKSYGTICDPYDSLKNTDSFIVRVPDAIPLLSPESFTFSPNPVKNILKVNAPIPIKNASLYNIQGIPFQLFYWDKATWDVSHIPPGLYFLYIDTDKGRSVHRIIKE